MTCVFLGLERANEVFEHAKLNLWIIDPKPGVLMPYAQKAFHQTKWCRPIKFHTRSATQWDPLKGCSDLHRFLPHLAAYLIEVSIFGPCFLSNIIGLTFQSGIADPLNDITVPSKVPPLIVETLFWVLQTFAYRSLVCDCAMTSKGNYTRLQIVLISELPLVVPLISTWVELWLLEYWINPWKLWPHQFTKLEDDCNFGVILFHHAHCPENYECVY